MVQRRTIMQAADNSGAKKLVLIGIPGYSRRGVATIGDVVTVVVRGASPTGTVKDAQIVKAVIVRTRKEIGRQDGTYIRFDENAAVIIDKDKNPVGTRIFGPVAKELRERGFSKIISLAQEVV